MKKQKKGISLIVLVITIIVMIILASAVIISLNNNGIIGKTSEAVDKTNEKQVQELANLAWVGAYAENVGKSEAELQAKLQEAIEKALSDNNLDKEDYGIEVTTTGVTIVKGWLQTKDRTVVKGSTTLEIGDYVNYVSGVEGYTDTNGWQVLGAENGELLIMSASDITKSANPYILNKVCEQYGKGTNATGARSITVDDIDRVTGYDKTTYGKGEIYEYGNVVTYSDNGTEYPAYSGTNGVTGTLLTDHNRFFYWYDENQVEHSIANLGTNSGIITDKNGTQAKIKSTFYGYDVNSETDLQKEAEKSYNMLFGPSDENSFLLASWAVHCDTHQVEFGFLEVRKGTISGYAEVISSGEFLDNWLSGVRAVVQLSQDTTITGSSASGWSIV